MVYFILSENKQEGCGFGHRKIHQFVSKGYSISTNAGDIDGVVSAAMNESFLELLKDGIRLMKECEGDTEKIVNGFNTPSDNFKLLFNTLARNCDRVVLVYPESGLSDDEYTGILNLLKVVQESVEEVWVITGDLKVSEKFGSGADYFRLESL